MAGETVWRDLIVGFRKKHALTQADAALRLSVSQQTISRWESGKQEPDTAAQAILREQLGMVAMTMRDSWMHRVALSAGREYLFEQGWRLISLSAKASEEEHLIGAAMLEKSLADQPRLNPLTTLLTHSGMFAGDVALIRVTLAFNNDGHVEGRNFDFWPVLTGTDEILVHAVAYQCKVEATVAETQSLRIIASSQLARDTFGHKSA